MRRFVVLAVLATGLAACGNPAAKTADAEGFDRGTTSTTLAPSVDDSTTTTTMAAAAFRWPLTGLPTEEAIDQPIVAAKVDNTSSGRPQEGLDQADLVFEVLVEGGIPRLIALFQSSIPEVVGPIRSLREVDPKLVAPFGVLFANSGGDAPVRALLTGVARDMGDPLLGSIAYFRATDRSAPYNLMLSTAGLMGQEPDEAPSTNWIEFDDAREDGEQALTVEISMSAAHDAIYRWSSTDQAYLRFNGERPHETTADVQITTENVVVLYVRQFDTGRRDRAGSVVPDYEVTGSGDAVLFRNGAAHPGTWERGSVDGFFRLFDEEGNPLPLAPGRSWFQIVPIGRTVTWQ